MHRTNCAAVIKNVCAPHFKRTPQGRLRKQAFGERRHYGPEPTGSFDPLPRLSVRGIAVSRKKKGILGVEQTPGDWTFTVPRQRQHTPSAPASRRRHPCADPPRGNRQLPFPISFSPHIFVFLSHFYSFLSTSLFRLLPILPGGKG